MCNPHIAADCCVMAYSDAAKNRCIGINSHIILYDRMTRHIDRMTVTVKREIFCAKCHSLINRYITSYYTSLAYHHTRAMIYTKYSPIVAPGCMSIPVSE